MSKDQRQLIKLTPLINFGELVSGLKLINIETNPSANEVYLLTKRSSTDYRSGISSASFSKFGVNEPQTFVIFMLHKFGQERVEIEGQNLDYHYVQSLPDDEILLVCGRSYYRSQEDFDLNGHVFDYEGELKRSFLLGDGIQDVQTTADGRIWTSYFDEGIFGNYGWRHPIGSPGLISWDKVGRKLYEYSPAYPLNIMADCYAMNVIGNQETWCYYYTEFPLVQIRNGEIANSWDSLIAGSHGFALWKDHVLFQGGYRKWEKDWYFLYKLGERGKMDLKAIYELINERGQKIKAEMRVARGNILYVMQDNVLYKLDVRDLVK